jgi:formylglycine-generating enzyme required for sulfatase activity
MKRRCFLVFGLAFIFLPLSLFAQNKYALVIGNGAYASMPALKNPANDAADMKAVLESLGFQVELLLNANLRQMEDGALRLAARLKRSSDAWGFFFYAGHGVQSRGENYLIPTDSDIRSENLLRERAVALRFLLDEMENAGNALNIVALDACRDNPFGWSRGASRGLTVVDRQPAGTVIVYAASADSAAEDGEGRNGLFTGHLVKNLKIPGLELGNMLRRTGADVRRASEGRQVPAIYIQFFDTAYLNGGPPPDMNVLPPAASAPEEPPPSPPPAPQAPAAAAREASAPRPRPAPRHAEVYLPPAARYPDRPAPAGFVRIPGGTFTMGSPGTEKGRMLNEIPHTVTLSAFYMGKHEVTQREYQALMGKNPSRVKNPDFPVENVSWLEAVKYCNARSLKEGLSPAYLIGESGVSWDRETDGYRLPTEAEWEFACRAGTTGAFSTGDTITTAQANYNADFLPAGNPALNYLKQPKAAGSYPPNAFGLYDMHGNVWEWCWDRNGSYGDQEQFDPTGPLGSHGRADFRIKRGGSCVWPAREARSAFRGSGREGVVEEDNGFRLVRP